jgi:hypothetical protein
MVSRLARGISTATKSTPLFIYPQDELNIAGKPVEPADDNDSFVSSAYVERVGELHFPPILDVSSEAKFSPCLLRIL